MAGFRILDDEEQPQGFRILGPQENPQGDARSQIGQPEELTFAERLVSGVKLPKWLEHIRSSRFGSIVQGLSDAPIGLMQDAANLLPDSTGIPQAVNRKVASLDRGYSEDRAAAGETGPDVGRFAGQVLSPVNMIPGALGMKAATTAGRIALQGGALGALGGASAEVTDNPESFWKEKAGQIALGAGTGAALSPLLSKVAEVALRRFGASPTVNASTHDVDGAIVSALKDAGQTPADLSPDQLQALRLQVSTSLQQGQKLDNAAVLRKADFDRLGIDPTLGQLTRDPNQFAREMNLRGVDGVGEPLMARFTEQGQRLQTALPQGGGKPAFQAGTQLAESLGGIDDTLRRHVSGLYGEARASAGKDLDVPLQGLAQDYGNILQRYGSNVPDAIRSRFAALGMDPANPGNQRQVFNFETANSLLQDLNKLDPRHTNPPVSSAIGEIRQALRGAIESTDSGGGPFAPAVKAAAERFKLHEAVPALKAAAEGSVAPDDFVRRFVVNGKTNEVKGLASVLRQADPASYQEARAQLADELRRAAFGEVNGATGDAPFAPARYMAAIRRLGPDKLGAFFTPEEVQDILTVGRVGSYMHAGPTKAPVSTSNSNVGLGNVLMRLPGLRQAGAVVNNVARPIQQRSDVSRALAAEVPASRVPLSDEQRNWLAYILAAGAGGAGAGLAR